MREENSSSQNVNLFIASIAERGSSGEGLTVRLSDGSSFFVSSSFMDEHHLSLNQEISDEILYSLERESEKIKALHKAGDLLSRAEQSSGGLFLKLRKRQFSDEACRYAVDRVIELGLLDDERFAGFWIASRIRQHPEGRSMLLQGLIARGVGPESASAAIEANLTDEDFKEAVCKAGRKLSSKYGSDNVKMKSALYRRGFSGEEIRYYFDNREI